MTGLLPIDTAPRDGTLFWGTHGRGLSDGEFHPLRKMFWGRGKPHRVDGVQSPYVVNGGNPWWMNEDGIKMAPRPTHWKPIASGKAEE